jgi:DNA polymerase-3 subunit gamma/tau
LLQAPSEFPALVERLAAGGKAHLAQQLHDFVGLVRYAPPELALKPLKPLAGDLARDLAAALKALTGAAWQVRLADPSSDEQAAPSLHEQEKTEAERLRQEVLDSPIVQAAFEAFPDAELAGYTIDDKRSA